jgi:hypothetical protein
MSKKNSKASKKTTKAKAPAKAQAAAKPQVNPTVEIVTGQPLPKKAKANPTVAKPPRLSGLNAAAQVLKDAGEPMTCKAMLEKMLAKGLWKTDGKTPAATLNAAIHREIATKADKSRFKKTDRGLFDLA